MSVSAFDKLRYLAEGGGSDETIDSSSLFGATTVQSDRIEQADSKPSIFARMVKQPTSVVVLVFVVLVAAIVVWLKYAYGSSARVLPHSMTSGKMGPDRPNDQLTMTTSSSDVDYEDSDARDAAAEFTKRKQIPMREEDTSTQSEAWSRPKEQRVTWADEASGQPLEQVREIPSVQIGNQRAWM